MGWLIPLFAFLAIGALVAYRLLVGKREPGYLAITEYWVYTNQDRLPEQSVLMDRMISTNPHNKKGNAAIGAREGMLFSDIRLHIGLAKREKNPHVFRPDLFEEDTVPTKQVLSELSNCRAMVKVRYLSEARLNDSRHLQFMPHLADAISGLMEGKVIFDHSAQKLFTAEEFFNILQQNGNVEKPESHVRVAWKALVDSGYTETYGLKKVGLRELVSDPQELDSEILITGLTMRLAYHLMRNPDDIGPFEFEEFGDTFVLTLGDIREGKQIVHITRRITKSS